MVALALSVLMLTASGAERGPVAVVLTSKRPGADALALKVATRVLEACRREEVTVPDDVATAMKHFASAGFEDTRSCQGRTACLVQLAVLRGPRAVVVGVDIATVAKQLSIHLEAVTADGEQSLEAADLLVRADQWTTETAVGFARFGRALKGKLSAPAAPAPVVAVAPAKAPLDADGHEVDEHAGHAHAAGVSHSHEHLKNLPKFVWPSDRPVEGASLTPGTLSAAGPADGPGLSPAGQKLAIGSGLAFVAAGVLGGLGLADRGRYQSQLLTLGGREGSRLTDAEARALASSTNTKLVSAAVSAAVALALGVTAFAVSGGDAAAPVAGTGGP